LMRSVCTAGNCQGWGQGFFHAGAPWGFYAVSASSPHVAALPVVQRREAAAIPSPQPSPPRSHCYLVSSACRSPEGGEPEGEGATPGLDDQRQRSPVQPPAPPKTFPLPDDLKALKHVQWSRVWHYFKRCADVVVCGCVCACFFSCAVVSLFFVVVRWSRAVLPVGLPAFARPPLLHCVCPLHWAAESCFQTELWSRKSQTPSIETTPRHTEVGPPWFDGVLC
jgi:hypothetical protein